MQFQGRRKLLVSRTRTKIDTVTKYQRRRFFQTCQHCKEKVSRMLLSLQNFFLEDSCAFSSVHDMLKYFMHFNFWHALTMLTNCCMRWFHLGITLLEIPFPISRSLEKSKKIGLITYPSCPPGVGSHLSRCQIICDWASEGVHLGILGAWIFEHRNIEHSQFPDWRTQFIWGKE